MQRKINYFDTYEINDLKDMLYKTTLRNQNKVAFRLKDNEGKIVNKTYLDFRKDVEALGTKLIEMGLKDKRIAIIGKNSYEWSISYLACVIIGIVVPLDKESSDDNIKQFLNSSRADAIISDTKYLDRIDSMQLNINPIKIDMQNTLKYTNFGYLIDDGKRMISNGNRDFIDTKINPDEMKILLFTSGTTGNSKGVMLSHKNICSNIISVAKIVKVDNSTSVLSILPLHHTYECTLGFLLVLYGGGNIAYIDGLKYITKNIQEFKPTFILCVPLLLENVYKKIIKTLKTSLPKKYTQDENTIIQNIPFYLKPIVKRKIKKSLGGKIKTFIVGAAAIKPEIVESFFSLGIKVLQGYGLTECSPLVAGNNDTCYKAASCGMPIPDVEYKIDNPNEEGVGEIIAKGPNIMLGYYENKEATDKVLINGWFHTGDLGYIDDEEFLYITGRSKNMILTKNGENIYPEEIENILNDSDLIEESLIIGASNGKDDVQVKAKIFPNIEAIKEYLGKKVPTKEDISKTINELIKKVNEKLPNFKHIKSYKIMDEDFERTTTNKVKRFGKNVEDDDKR
ncbi:MAG TPA: AMP-dependent synthetase [Clostridiales bacterium]|nr:AMP-dependent synthetase [Clostridiales bacterium]